MKDQAMSFRSFFMGGFECTDLINRSGLRINLLHETGHHLRAFEDYELLSSLEINVVREGVCWSVVEKSPYVFDFSSLKDRMDAAAALNIQILWDLCHFGYPDDMIPTHPLFHSRFMAFCRAFTLFHLNYSAEKLFVIPINEISFLSRYSGEMRGTVPFALNSQFDIKYHLSKAAIAGIEVIKQTDPDAVVILAESLNRLHEGDGNISPDRLEEIHQLQYEAIDIISGTKYPELGGSPALYDMVGFNYSYNKQVEINDPHLICPIENYRTIPLSKLLKEGYHRYNKPVIITQTGHFGKGRSRWIEEVTLECDRALSMGVDLRGICIYPIIDRPDWDNLLSYNNCGLWDLDEFKNRIPYDPVINSVKKCIQLIETRIPTKVCNAVNQLSD